MPNVNRLSYDELSKIVLTSFKKTNDIRETGKETGISFPLVWDMMGYKDYFDFYDNED
jgi:hypothetical protein